MRSDLVVMVVLFGAVGLLVVAALGVALVVWRAPQQERQRRADQLGSVYHSRERRERKDR